MSTPAIWSLIKWYLDMHKAMQHLCSCLRECPEYGKAIPVQAVGVELYNIVPPQRQEWTEEAVKAMTDCLLISEEKQFLAFVKESGDPPQVELYDPNTNTLAYDSALTNNSISFSNV
ncbi:hypothetical protein SK128_013548 [Halocaridina rubra]|uniref:Uncharacterized protein n=1 Tax=Halocaridina rubra TaxID=373956 RepID=A0AAN8ZS74_HALRR